MPGNEYPLSSLGMFIDRNLPPFTLSRACSRKRLRYVQVLLSGCQQCDLLPFPRCVSHVVRVGGKNINRMFIELVITFALYVSHALGATFSRGNAEAASHLWSSPNSVSASAKVPGIGPHSNLLLPPRVLSVLHRPTSSSSASSLVSPRRRHVCRPHSLRLSVVVHSVRQASCEAFRCCVGSWHDFDDCVFDFRELL